jgi:hypothetical protein
MPVYLGDMIAMGFHGNQSRITACHRKTSRIRWRAATTLSDNPKICLYDVRTKQVLIKMQASLGAFVRAYPIPIKSRTNRSGQQIVSVQPHATSFLHHFSNKTHLQVTPKRFAGGSLCRITAWFHDFPEPECALR